MRRTLAALLAAALLITLPPMGDRPAAAVGRDRVVRCNGCWPAAFAFTPNGKHIFYAERLSGEIRKVTVEGRKDRRWARIPDVASGGEQGVLGLALDPEWDQGRKQQWVYVYYTEESPHRNRIVRLRRRKGGGVKTDRLVSLAANDFHDGGVLHFGPDGRLYAVTGDAQVPSRAQEKRNLAGKVLRLEQNGGRPCDNPIGGSKAFSYGHRNSFGFAFDPLTGLLWQSENGPDCDELNLVVAGGNYGWGPGSDCPGMSTEGPSPTAAELEYMPVIVPTGVSFCSGCGLGAAVEGDLLLAVFGDGTQIRHLSVDGERDDVVDEQVLYDHGSGVVALERRPNGQVFFSDRSGIYRLEGP
jgi:glucose/arabinose dehydrogenase